MYQAAQNLPLIFVCVEQKQCFPFHIVNMETSSVHQSTSQSDCDGNTTTPVASYEAADIVNAIVDAGPTVCSTLFVGGNFIEKNHDMAVVMAMAEGAIYKGEPILVKALEEAIINAKKKKKLIAKVEYLKDKIKQ